MARKASGKFTGADGKRAVAKRDAAAASVQYLPSREPSERVRELAEKEGPRSIEVLAEIRDDPEVPAAARATAARTLLEYGMGRPTTQKSTGPKGLSVQILHLATGDHEAKTIEAETREAVAAARGLLGSEPPS